MWVDQRDPRDLPEKGPGPGSPHRDNPPVYDNIFPLTISLEFQSDQSNAEIMYIMASVVTICT